MANEIKERKILFIDDERFLRETAAHRLREEGFEVTEAKNGDDGLALAPKVKPDIIILDILMPGKIGYTVLEELKKDERTRPIPVLVFTRLAPADGEGTALKLGATAFMSKIQGTVGDLVKKINAILKSK